MSREHLRWPLLGLLCIASALLVYGLVQDWQVGEHFAYEWSRGFGDAIAHWSALIVIMVTALVAFSMIVTATRLYRPTTPALTVTAFGTVGAVATVVAMRRIAADPGFDKENLFLLRANGVGGELSVTMTRAPVVTLLAFVVVIACGAALWILGRQASHSA